MTAKEYLNQLHWLDAGIDSKLDQLERLNALATRTTTAFSDTPHACEPDPGRHEDIIIKILDLEDRIKVEMDKLMALKSEIVHTINQVSSVEQKAILEKRYLCFLPWEEVAKETHYSIQHVFRLHGYALKEIDEIIKMRVNDKE